MLRTRRKCGGTPKHLVVSHQFGTYLHFRHASGTVRPNLVAGYRIVWKAFLVLPGTRSIGGKCRHFGMIP